MNTYDKISFVFLSILTRLPSVGCSESKRLRASDVLRFAMFSSQRPKDTNVNSIGGVSKNVFGLCADRSAIAMNKTMTCKKKKILVTMSGSLLLQTKVRMSLRRQLTLQNAEKIPKQDSRLLNNLPFL